MSRRRVALAALCALIVIGAAWIVWPTPPSNPTTAKSSESATTTVGVPMCPLESLPRQVSDTVRLIRSNGPFPFPRNDGVVFGNREGHLPDEVKGYYHEYTVITPSARNRSTRRIITGGPPVTNPREYFYTGDHYDSFCLVTGTGRQS